MLSIVLVFTAPEKSWNHTVISPFVSTTTDHLHLQVRFRTTVDLTSILPTASASDEWAWEQSIPGVGLKPNSQGQDPHAWTEDHKTAERVGVNIGTNVEFTSNGSINSHTIREDVYHYQPMTDNEGMHSAHQVRYEKKDSRYECDFKRETTTACVRFNSNYTNVNFNRASKNKMWARSVAINKQRLVVGMPGEPNSQDKGYVSVYQCSVDTDHPVTWGTRCSDTATTILSETPDVAETSSFGEYVSISGSLLAVSSDVAIFTYSCPSSLFDFPKPGDQKGDSNVRCSTTPTTIIHGVSGPVAVEKSLGILLVSGSSNTTVFQCATEPVDATCSRKPSTTLSKHGSLTIAGSTLAIRDSATVYLYKCISTPACFLKTSVSVPCNNAVACAARGFVSVFGTTMVVGVGKADGSVAVSVFTISAELSSLTQVSSVSPPTGGAPGWGHAASLSAGVLAVGAPDSKQVFLYKCNPEVKTTPCREQDHKSTGIDVGSELRWNRQNLQWNKTAPGSIFLARESNIHNLTTGLDLYGPDTISPGWTPQNENFVNKPVYKFNSSSTIVSHIIGNGSAGWQDGVRNADPTFSKPMGIALDKRNEKLYVADSLSHAIRVVDLINISVTTVAGNGGQYGYRNGIGTDALFNTPVAVAISPGGDYLYVSDSMNHRIRRIQLATRQTSAIAGDGTAGYRDGTGSYHDAPGSSGSLHLPSGLAVAPDGRYLVISDHNNRRLRTINIASARSIRRSRSSDDRFAVDEDLYEADLYTLTGTSRRSSMSSTGSTTRWDQKSLDGVGTGATFAGPQGLAFTPDGSHMFVADREGNKIRQVTVKTTQPTVPGPPLLYSVTSTSFVISWLHSRAIPLVDKYEIQYRELSGVHGGLQSNIRGPNLAAKSEWKTIVRFAKTGTALHRPSTTLTDMIPNTNYGIRVRAHNTAGWSAWTWETLMTTRTCGNSNAFKWVKPNGELYHVDGLSCMGHDERQIMTKTHTDPH